MDIRPYGYWTNYRQNGFRLSGIRLSLALDQAGLDQMAIDLIRCNMFKTLEIFNTVCLLIDDFI